MARSGSKQFFAQRAEVIDWLTALRETQPFWMVVLPSGHLRPAVVVNPTEPPAAPLADAKRVFFASEPPPAGTAGKNANQLGLTDAYIMLDLPEEKQDELRMGVLAFQSTNPLAAELFASAKRTFGARLRNGVWGVQGKARRRYRELAFSPGAVSALRGGKTWRGQFGGLAHFEPDLEATSHAQ